jgi:hypothetical protein
VPVGGVAAVAVMGALLLFGASAGGQTEPKGGIPVSVRSELLKYALTKAAAEGDSHPYDIEAVLTTFAAAEGVLSAGDRLPGCESVPLCATWPTYAVAMRGRFVCNTCKIPPGAKDPRGTVIVFNRPAKAPPPTEWSQDFGLSDRYPNLKKLGLPIHLAAAEQKKKLYGKTPSPKPAPTCVPLLRGTEVEPGKTVRVPVGELVRVTVIEAEGDKSIDREFPWSPARSSNSKVLRRVPSCPREHLHLSLRNSPSSFRAIHPGRVEIRAPVVASWRALPPEAFEKGLERPELFRATVIVLPG